MKKRIIIIVVVFVFIALAITGGLLFYKDYRIKHATVIIDLKDDMTVEFLSEVRVSDFIENINGIK